MSHHGEENISNRLREELGLGPTGKYPNGKYTDTDQGEIRMAISADPKNSKVVIHFGKSLDWIAFTPEQAFELGESLKLKSFEARGIMQ